MKRIIIITILTLCFLHKASAQQIFGSTTVQPGSWENYTCSFPLGGFGGVTWSVSGGTIAYQDNFSCSVIWGAGPYGDISASEAISGDFASLNVMIGSPNPSLGPTAQSVNFGVQPSQLEVTLPGWNVQSYEWEESLDAVTWTTISGAMDWFLLLGGATDLRYYRCRLIIDGTAYYTNEATVSISGFTGGTIYMGQPAVFNAAPVIGNSPATGGYCYSINYQYSWEESIAGSPWVVIGNTRNFPGTTPITENRQYRRKATCVGQSAYSNILNVIPDYTFIDNENRNYLREYSVLVPAISSIYQADQLPVGDKIQTTTYLDGLGREEQVVSKEVSSINGTDWNDVVQPLVYDGAGRADRKYLPYVSTNASEKGKFKSNAIAEQETFTRTKFNEPAGTTAPTFAQYFFEDNPLDRVQQVKLPGHYFAGNTAYTGQQTQYKLNESQESIKRWTVPEDNSLPPSANSVYAENLLYKVVRTDENQLRTIEYYDKEEKLILKKVQEKNTGPDLNENGYEGWICTYNIYDDMDRLRYVITPKAVQYLISNGWSFSGFTVIDELCFSYRYDKKGRVIVKHSPGAGYIYYVYDRRNRVVLSQDENQRSKSPAQWTFTLYDDLDREVVTGLFNNTSSFAALQTYADNLPLSNQAVTVYTGATETVNCFASVIGSGNSCSNCSNIVVNRVSYFDVNNYSGSYTFSSNFSFPAGAVPNVQPTVQSERTINFVTGAKVRILDQNYDDGNPLNDVFVKSTIYYDDKGRVLQKSMLNVKNGIDITTHQYDFVGKMLAVSEIHNIPSAISPINNFPVVSRFTYDKAGRIILLEKKYSNQPYKKIKQTAYDELGKVKLNKLSPDFNGGAGLETLTYDYNMHGQLVGINKGYALSNSSLAQWDNYFGVYLGYESRDNTFAAGRLNGQVSGIVWKTQGSNKPRKYNYSYDNINRLTAAAFTQKESPVETGWTNSKMDFSVSDLQYDANGNITQQYQKGILPGTAGGILIDKLQYTYKTVAGAQWSNKLEKVFDNAPALDAVSNGSLGDFKDELYGVNTGLDYVYDGNGNLVTDNNKKIRTGSNPGVAYNYLNKVQKAVVDGKSNTEYTYDANGETLAKKVTDIATTAAVTQWYINGFSFEETSTRFDLQYIEHETGRVRVFKPVSPVLNHHPVLGQNFDLPNGCKGVFEYYVKDHLESVRMVLTEESHQQVLTCTMETGSNQSFEESNFGQLTAVVPYGPDPATNEVIKTRKSVGQPGFPTGWNTYLGNSVSVLSTSTSQIGPNLMLKVMAGDRLVLSTRYYFENQGSSNTATNLGSAVVQAISGIFTNNGNTNPIKNNISNVGTLLNTGGSGTLQQLLSNQNSNPSTLPSAYLTYLFFDENFNFIPYDPVTGLGSNSAPVTTAGNGQAINLPNVAVPQNGYAYVYVSNSSVNKTVSFDEFSVTHIRGQLINENSYYAYGLKIKGLCAKAIDKLDNRFGYQGTFAEEQEETGWNEFALRNYDPQIGRWTGVDPYDEFSSGYVGMGNDPAAMIDPDGGDIWNILTPAIFSGLMNVANNYGKLEGKRNSFWKGLAYFGVGAAAGAITGALAEGGFTNSGAEAYSGSALFDTPLSKWASVAIGGIVAGVGNMLLFAAYDEDDAKTDLSRAFALGFSSVMTGANMAEKILPDLFKHTEFLTPRPEPTKFMEALDKIAYGALEGFLSSYGAHKGKIDIGQILGYAGTALANSAAQYGLGEFSKIDGLNPVLKYGAKYGGGFITDMMFNPINKSISQKLLKQKDKVSGTFKESAFWKSLFKNSLKGITTIL